MSHIDSASNLYRSLAQECDLAMALVDVLLEEQTCLIKLETVRLTELALQKEGMMLDLEKRYLNHLQQARLHGFSANMNGIADWVDSLGGKYPKLQGTYSTLRSTLEHAQRLNKTNGDLVAEQLAGLNERISILTAAAIGDQVQSASDTYSAKGALHSAAVLGLATPRAVIR